MGFRVIILGFSGLLLAGLENANAGPRQIPLFDGTCLISAAQNTLDPDASVEAWLKHFAPLTEHGPVEAYKRLQAALKIERRLQFVNPEIRRRIREPFEIRFLAHEGISGAEKFSDLRRWEIAELLSHLHNYRFDNKREYELAAYFKKCMTFPGITAADRDEIVRSFDDFRSLSWATDYQPTLPKEIVKGTVSVLNEPWSIKHTVEHLQRVTKGKPERFLPELRQARDQIRTQIRRDHYRRELDTIGFQNFEQTLLRVRGEPLPGLVKDTIPDLYKDPDVLARKARLILSLDPPEWAISPQEKTVLQNLIKAVK